MKKLAQLLNTVDYFYTLASGDENFAKLKNKALSKALMDEWESKLDKPIDLESEDDFDPSAGGSEQINDDEEPEPEEEPEEEDDIDTGMYADILDYGSRRVSDSDFADQFLVIAAVYKKALTLSTQVGRPVGLNLVMETCNTLTNELEAVASPESMDDDDSQSEEENHIDFLNEIQSDLRKRAGGIRNLLTPDSPDLKYQMSQFKKNHNVNAKEINKALKNHFTGEKSNVGTRGAGDLVGENEGSKDFSSGELGNDGRVVEEAPEVSDDPDAEVSPDGEVEGEDLYKGNHKFDGTKDVDGRATDQHLAGKENVSFPTKYKNESEAYATRLADLTNPAAKKVLTKLVAVTAKLSEAKQEELDAGDRIKNQGGNAGPELIKDHEVKKKVLTKLKKDKSKLVEEFRIMNVSNVVQDLTSKVQSSKSANERFIAQQTLELFAIRAAKVTNKSEEIEARKKLINTIEPVSTTGINKGERYIAIQFDNATNLPVSEQSRNTVAKLLANIEAAKNVPRETFEDMHVRLAAKKKKRKEMDGKAIGIDTAGDLLSQYDKLSEHVPSLRSGDKSEIMKKWRERLISDTASKEYTDFKPFIDAVIELKAQQAALPKGSKEESKALTKQITDAMETLYQKMNKALGDYPEQARAIEARIARVDENFKDYLTLQSNIKSLLGTEKAPGILARSTLSANEKTLVIAQLLALQETAQELSTRSYTDPYGTPRKNTKSILENTAAALGMETTRIRDLLES